MSFDPAVPSLEIAEDRSSAYPGPFPKGKPESSCRMLGEHFGLAQFGVSFNTLAPGDQAGLRHWHSLEEEFIYVLEGVPTLRTDDGDVTLRPGMCVGFRAGKQNGHLMLNRSSAIVRYLIVGSRVPGDIAFYPDDDLAWLQTPAGTVAVHKDGRPY